MKPEAGFRRPSHLRHLVRSAMSTPALRTLPTIKFCKPFSAPRQHAQPFWLESDSSMGPSVRVHRPRPRARGHARSPTPPIRRTSAATRALTALVLTVRVRATRRRPAARTDSISAASGPCGPTGPCTSPASSTPTASPGRPWRTSAGTPRHSCRSSLRRTSCQPAG